MKYSDDTINKMARKALYLEKTKQFDEALNIYMELASFDNEFARDRIPVIKHKMEQSKLKNVNFFLKLITLGVSVLTAFVISTSILDNILIKPVSVVKPTNNSYETSFNENNIKLNFSEINEVPSSIRNSDLEILVDSNIPTKQLKNRAIEALNLYKSELYLNKGNLKILIKTLKDRKVVGYIDYNNTEDGQCSINLIKK